MAQSAQTQPAAQAYLDETARKERFGAEAEQLQQKIQAAVEQTDGMVITYDDTLIDAVYFSCSGGQTEDAAAVWGNTRPYLVSVQSPGEEAAPHDTDLTTVALDTFCQTLQKAGTGHRPVGQSGGMVRKPDRDAGRRRSHHADWRPEFYRHPASTAVFSALDHVYGGSDSRRH